MGLRGLTDKAKQVFEQRGGSERLKQDGEALKGIARGEGSLSDKAKAGMERLRKPAGGSGETGAGRADDPPPPARTDPHPAPGSPPTSAEPPGAPPSRS
ncbi:MAG: hypothetical protein M3459_02005 [Actinomycetota bacterium]|nr:hypothetical protein [Actinomycetota bacterium]